LRKTNLFWRLDVKSALHTCLFFTIGKEFTMEPIVYNGNVTSMQNYRYKRMRERMSDSVNKASKVIESFSVTMTLNLTSANDDVTGTRHTYCVLITFNWNIKAIRIAIICINYAIYYCREILIFLLKISYN